MLCLLTGCDNLEYDRTVKKSERCSKLVEKIRAGGKGVWGETNMPAHPGLSPAEAKSIIEYVMQNISIVPLSIVAE